MAQLYRKTATVEARQWNPDSPLEVLTWLANAGASFHVFDDGRLGIGTLESGDGMDRHAGKPGDWVIRGAGGEFYACDADIFARTYEQVGS
jgi:hypothetical protein